MEENKCLCGNEINTKDNMCSKCLDEVETAYLAQENKVETKIDLCKKCMTMTNHKYWTHEGKTIKKCGKCDCLTKVE